MKQQLSSDAVKLLPRGGGGGAVYSAVQALLQRARQRHVQAAPGRTPANSDVCAR